METPMCRKDKWRRRVMWLGWGVVGVGVALVAGTVPFLLPALRKYCLPYVPATANQTMSVIRVLKSTPQGRVVDLGSGDGRVVIATALHTGRCAVGYELNYWLVIFSRLKALYHGVSRQTQFHRQDLWKVDLSGFDTVVIFGVDQMMKPLGRKLVEETKPGAHIIACRFPFEHWSPSDVVEQGVDSVWLYNMDNIRSQLFMKK